MRNTTKSNIKKEQTELENSKKDFEDNFKYEELKRQIRRKHHAIKKQIIRRYLKEEDPDYIIIINNKTYGNPGGKIRKKRRRSSGSSDSNTNTIRIRPNPPPLYNTDSEQEWRIFVNTLDNYWDVQDIYISDKHKIKKSSNYFKGKTANDWATTKEQKIISTI